jgi:hypothetical protein
MKYHLDSGFWDILKKGDLIARTWTYVNQGREFDEEEDVSLNPTI